MLEFIKGDINEITPTYVVIENNNLGYYVNISLITYAQIQEKPTVKLFLHEVIREDAWVLYGFVDRRERECFLLLLSISGIGANTARMILSSLSVNELEEAILSNNVNLIKGVKGIGLKTAQRVIVELKDKITKTSSGSEQMLASIQSNTKIKTEALEALVMLGFNRSNAEKALDKLLKSTPDMNVEKAVKEALRIL